MIFVESEKIKLTVFGEYGEDKKVTIKHGDQIRVMTKLGIYNMVFLRAYGTQLEMLLLDDAFHTDYFTENINHCGVLGIDADDILRIRKI